MINESDPSKKDQKSGEITVRLKTTIRAFLVKSFSIFQILQIPKTVRLTIIIKKDRPANKRGVRPGNLLKLRFG